MKLLIDPTGGIRGVYAETIDLRSLGEVAITRASHVEPDVNGRWIASITNGPTLGPFDRRSDALVAELAWLDAHWLTAPNA